MSADAPSPNVDPMEPSFEPARSTGAVGESEASAAEIRDLRWLIAEHRSAGELLDIKRTVSLDGELGSVLHAAEKAGKAALFHSVTGYDIPVVGGLISSRRKSSIALGCPESGLLDRIRGASAAPIPPEVVGGDAPSQRMRVDPVDLRTLPIPIHAPEDAGAFINAGIVIARDPASGRHNLSFNRMQVFDGTTAGVNMNTWRDMDEFLRRAEKGGSGLPFAVAIGTDPTLLMAAAFRYEDGDEYEIAGALRGAPIPVVPALTCDVLVPAYAEFIIEGEVVGGERRQEGPMAEFTGHYSGVRPQPIAEIRAITHRPDPIFQTIAGASREHLTLGNALMREHRLESTVKLMSPRIVDVHLPGPGFAAIVSMDNPRPGEARSVAIAALSFHANTKCVIVVDDDIDIQDADDVLWAISTRVRWESGCIQIPGALGNPLDPSSDSDSVQTKVIIDATLGPERREVFHKVRYPEVVLRDYLDD